MNELEYSIDVLETQFEKAVKHIAGDYKHAKDGKIVFENKRQLLRAGSSLVLHNIKILKTSGI